MRIEEIKKHFQKYISEEENETRLQVYSFKYYTSIYFHPDWTDENENIPETEIDKLGIEALEEVGWKYQGIACDLVSGEGQWDTYRQHYNSLCFAK